MRVSEIAVLKSHDHYFQSRIPKLKEGKYIQIVVLRETKSHTIFTTEGQALHVEPEHRVWGKLLEHLGHGRKPTEPILHWTRLAEPVFENGRCNAVRWRLVA